MSSAQPGLAKLDRFKGCIPGLFENDPACATCGPARPPNSHRPLDRLHQLAPEAGPFGADADLVAEVLTRCRQARSRARGRPRGPWPSRPIRTGGTATSRPVFSGPARNPLSILAAGSAAAADIRFAHEAALGRWANGADQRVER